MTNDIKMHLRTRSIAFGTAALCFMTLSASALAQKGASDETAAQPAVKTSEGNKTASAPVAGRNSFTEGEAKSRIESRGYSQVSGLQKDDQGVWRGTAMKDGRRASVALDYQGNVTDQKP
ncbi:MAG: hypothetical protein JWM91_4676 [Rhodospirillales bacterium]|nr:hypothetical protein [Rhodospirillales bacterium]